MDKVLKLYGYLTIGVSVAAASLDIMQAIQGVCPKGGCSASSMVVSFLLCSWWIISAPVALIGFIQKWDIKPILPAYYAVSLVILRYLSALDGVVNFPSVSFWAHFRFHNGGASDCTGHMEVAWLVSVIMISLKVLSSSLKAKASSTVKMEVSTMPSHESTTRPSHSAS